MFPRHAAWTANLACTPRLRILLFLSTVPQVLVHKDTVPVSWFSQQTAEHVLHTKNMYRLLHPIQEYVNIVLQRLLTCISVNLALFQSGQRSAPLPSWNVSSYLYLCFNVCRIVLIKNKHSNVSRSPESVSLMWMYQGAQADDKLSFPHHRGQIRL